MTVRLSRPDPVPSHGNIVLWVEKFETTASIKGGSREKTSRTPENLGRVVS